MNRGTVTASYATGSVTNSGSGDFASGLVGYNHSTGRVTASYATGSVTGGGLVSSIGGLVGWNQGTVTASYATGSVTAGSLAASIGGLVGWNRSGGTVTASYATGRVSGGNQHVGGLVGQNNGTVTNGYWDTQTSGQSGSGGGDGKTTAQLRQPTGYTGIYAGLERPERSMGPAVTPRRTWDFGGNHAVSRR